MNIKIEKDSTLPIIIKQVYTTAYQNGITVKQEPICNDRTQTVGGDTPYVNFNAFDVQIENDSTEYAMTSNIKEEFIPVVEKETETIEESHHFSANNSTNANTPQLIISDVRSLDEPQTIEENDNRLWKIDQIIAANDNIINKLYSVQKTANTASSLSINIVKPKTIKKIYAVKKSDTSTATVMNKKTIEKPNRSTQKTLNQAPKEAKSYAAGVFLKYTNVQNSKTNVGQSLYDHQIVTANEIRLKKTAAAGIPHKNSLNMLNKLADPPANTVELFTAPTNLENCSLVKKLEIEHEADGSINITHKISNNDMNSLETVEEVDEHMITTRVRDEEYKDEELNNDGIASSFIIGTNYMNPKCKIKLIHCTRCTRKFTDKKEYNAHVEKHEKQDKLDGVPLDNNLISKVYTCTICLKNFTVVFYSYRIIHRFTCDACRSKFTQVSLNSHLPHERECRLCGLKFFFLKRHMLTCGKETTEDGSKKSSKCCFCGKMFKSVRCKRRHLLTCGKEMPDEEFEIKKETLEEDSKIKKEKEDESKIKKEKTSTKCSYCGKIYKSIKCKKNHMKNCKYNSNR